MKIHWVSLKKLCKDWNSKGLEFKSYILSASTWQLKSVNRFFRILTLYQPIFIKVDIINLEHSILMVWTPPLIRINVDLYRLDRCYKKVFDLRFNLVAPSIFRRILASLTFKGIVHILPMYTQNQDVIKIFRVFNVDVANCILATPMMRTSVRDQLCWHFSFSGAYYVHFVYASFNAMVGRSFQDTNNANPFDRLLWKLI